MGLDQYVNKVKREEVYYWRKEYALQEWFEVNYEQQNCVPTMLTEYVLNHLLNDLNDLDDDGFFNSCEYSGDDIWREELIKVFSEYLANTKENEVMYEYDCWY